MRHASWRPSPRRSRPQSLSHHARRDDAQRVAGRERNRSLGDEREAEDPGRLAGLTLLGQPPLAEQDSRQWRGHAGDHDGRHRFRHARGDEAHGEGLISPSAAPRSAALLPCMLPSPVVSWSGSQETGSPMT